MLLCWQISFHLPLLVLFLFFLDHCCPLLICGICITSDLFLGTSHLPDEFSNSYCLSTLFKHFASRFRWTHCYWGVLGINTPLRCTCFGGMFRDLSLHAWNIGLAQKWLNSFKRTKKSCLVAQLKTFVKTCRFQGVGSFLRGCCCFMQQQRLCIVIHR